MRCRGHRHGPNHRTYIRLSCIFFRSFPRICSQYRISSQILHKTKTLPSIVVVGFKLPHFRVLLESISELIWDVSEPVVRLIIKVELEVILVVSFVIRDAKA